MPAAKTSKANPRQIEYALERLYEDQEPDWVVDTIPAVLGWLPGAARTLRQPYGIGLKYMSVSGGRSERIALTLSWDIDALVTRDPSLRAHVERMRSGRTAQREHVVQLAAEGLALVAISVLLPGRRVMEMRRGEKPDLLFDGTPGAIRGVEVAGRTTGGRSTLASVRAEKLPSLSAAHDIVELYLSLWCAEPRVADFRKIKP